MLPPTARCRAALCAAAISAVALALPSGASAATVSCPGDEIYTMAAGQASLLVEGKCTSTAEPVTYSITVPPLHGSLAPGSATTATYTPFAGFSGTDTFAYRATDADGDHADATASIVVPEPAGGNLPPVCPDPLRVFVNAGGSVLLTGSCADPEGGNVGYGIVTVPPEGGLSLIPPNQAVYAPPDGVESTSFQYSATDSAGRTTIATVLITVVPAGTTEVSTAPAATPETPFVAGVRTDGSGPVTIAPRDVSDLPDAPGYTFLDHEFQITAPAQTADNPLRLTFTVDRAFAPATGALVAFRDGAAVDTPCAPGAAAAPADPCVETSGFTDPADPQSDYRIVIRTSRASVWHLGFVPPARPASKADCADSGWRRFPGFKNQGDCVSWIATHGRNQPAG